LVGDNEFSLPVFRRGRILIPAKVCCIDNSKHASKFEQISYPRMQINQIVVSILFKDPDSLFNFHQLSLSQGEQFCVLNGILE